MHIQTTLVINEMMIGQFGPWVHICPLTGAMEQQSNTKCASVVRQNQMRKTISTILIILIIGIMGTGFKIFII